jgi:protocatechuate 3,4-dioxygenase beta subunit
MTRQPQGPGPKAQGKTAWLGAARLLPFALCLLPSGFLFAQQPARDTPLRPPPLTSSGVIAGTVLTDDTPPQPARKSRVMLNEVSSIIPGRTTTTDDAGRFLFRDLPAGRYNLQAAKPGYLSVNHGATRPGRAGTPIAIGAAEKRNDVVFRISRGGVITGTVRDQSGQPAPGVGVNVLRYGYSPVSGERMLSRQTISSMGTTDDRGVYRAWGLSPGEYVVVVTPGPDQRIPEFAQLSRGLEEIRRLSPAEVQQALALVQGRRGGAPPASPQPQLSPASAPVNYAPVFYPGTANLAHAMSISLVAGEERTGVDVQFNLVPTARLEGVCTLPEGVAAQTIAVTLEFSGSPVEIQQGIGVPRTRTMRLTPDGRYSFSGVTPGQYTIAAKTAEPTAGRGRGAAGPPERLATSAPVWWAIAEVDVAGQNLDVPLDLQPAMTMTGRLVFEGALPRPDDFTGLRGYLVPRNAGGNLGAGPPGGQVDKDGRFMFSGVTPGSYRVFWTGAPKPFGWSMKSAVALGIDVLDAPLEIKAGMPPIEWVVTYTDRETKIEGTLQDVTGRPASDYFIVVFTTDRAKWTARTRLVQTTRPATDGAYSVSMPAGEFCIVALTDLESGETNNPAFLEQLIPGAIKITVADGEKKKFDIRIAGR